MVSSLLAILCHFTDLSHLARSLFKQRRGQKRVRTLLSPETDKGCHREAITGEESSLRNPSSVRSLRTPFGALLGLNLWAGIWVPKPGRGSLRPFLTEEEEEQSRPGSQKTPGSRFSERRRPAGRPWSNCLPLSQTNRYQKGRAEGGPRAAC